MILAAVEDLLFSSKIRNVAKRLGIPIAFARTPEAILERARASTPKLIVLDLNSPTIDAVTAVAALKADPALARVETLGFVSHVDVATEQAALAAGVDTVLSRGAFVAHLPDLLERAR
jgi:CheY-like chemotaxis protein